MILSTAGNLFHRGRAWVQNFRGKIRFGFGEWLGSLGDMGTFVPLLLAYSSQCGMSMTPMLLFAGGANILTGFLTGLPLCVQPMKSIAAMAIANQWTPGMIAMAGTFIGLLLLLIQAWSPLYRLVVRFPLNLVRGIQFGLGLVLLFRGLKYLRFAAPLIDIVPMTANGNWSVSWRELTQVLFLGVLPQLPLTLFNSVLAVIVLCRDLFPESTLKERDLMNGIGVMNLTAPWFGAMPMCFGVGGIAGQYAWGARTGGSIVILGTLQIGLVLIWGNELSSSLAHVPGWFLAATLFSSAFVLFRLVWSSFRRWEAIGPILATGSLFALSQPWLGLLFGGLVEVLIRQIRRTPPHSTK